MLETKIREPCLMGDSGAQCLKAPLVKVLLLMDGPPGRGLFVMDELQHNVSVILLS